MPDVLYSEASYPYTPSLGYVLSGTIWLNQQRTVLSAIGDPDNGTDLIPARPLQAVTFDAHIGPRPCRAASTPAGRPAG